MALQYAAVKTVPAYIQEYNTFAFLDDVLVMLQSGLIERGMDLLVPNLHDLYASTSTSEWEQIVNKVLLRHPLRNMLMQDPLTARSFAQPRGYAGDAVLLDMVYFHGNSNESGVSTLGNQLHRYTARTPLCLALSKRMRLLSRYIDKTAERTTNARILSLASGHCREAALSEALRNNKLGRFVALDHDVDSLNTMKNEYCSLELEAVPLSVSDIVKGKLDLGTFDLIYSAGLYDYLSKRFAQKLTSQLYSLLAPGGKLMLCNIAMNYYEVGYLESYMNWEMIGRGRIEVLELAADLKGIEKAKLRVLDNSAIDSHFHILEIDKC